MSYLNKKYRTEKGNEVIVLGESESHVRFVVIRQNREGCQTKQETVGEFAAMIASGERVFEKEGVYILGNSLKNEGMKELKN
jgi:hypothetical protein